MATILPQNSVTIRCICQYDHDDNFTIQCERCNAWQHARCLQIENEESIPSVYLCPECSGTLDQVDVKAAKYHQRLFVQRKTTIERALRAKNADGEEPKKRGRKKLSELAKQREDQQKSFFDPQFYNVNKSVHTWSSKAKDLWDQICSDIVQTPCKDLKPSNNFKIAETEDDKKTWKFGLNSSEMQATANITRGRIICEVVGEVSTTDEYKANTINQFDKIGCPKPGVFFTPNLPLVIDCRRHGSQAVFLTRSSTPNAKLVTARTNNDELKLLVVARKPIRPNQTISLGWHWPVGHPFRQLKSEQETDSETEREGTEPPEADDYVTFLLWSIGIPLKDCLSTAADTHTENGDDEEDWSLTVSTFYFKKQEPKPEKKRSVERLEAPEDWIFTEAETEPVETNPTKKRLSLADYMKKRT